MIPLGVNGGESFGERCFARMGGGGAVIVEGFKDKGACLARLSEGVAKDPTTFTGEFTVLEAFEVGVRGDVKPLRGSVV